MAGVIAEPRAPTGPRGLIGRIRRRMPSGSLARSVAMLAGSTAVGQLVAVAASPVLTRLFTPGEMGLLGVYTATVLLLMPVASGRYELAIPLARREDTAANLLAVSLLVALALSAMVGAVVYLWGDPLLRLVDATELRPHLWLFPLGLLAAAGYQALSGWAIRAKEFGEIARTRLSQSVLMVLVQLGGGAAGGGTAILLLGDALGRAGGTLRLGRLTWTRSRKALGRVRWSRMLRAAHRYRRFPLISSGSALLNTAGLQLPALLLAALYGPHVAGWFILGQRVIGLPSRLVGQAIGQVYVGEAARLIRERPEALPGLFHRLVRRLLLIGAVPVVMVGLVAPPVFARVFGAEWHSAGVYVWWLTPMFVAQIVVSPISQSAALLERQGVQLVADALRTVAVFAAIGGAALLDWSDTAAVGAYSLCMLVTYVGYFEMYRRLLRGVAQPADVPGSRTRPVS